MAIPGRSAATKGSASRTGDTADYIAAWRRIALIYKNTVPGAVMVWNTLKNPPVNWARYYPGDDVVGLVSIDLYDNGAGGFFSADNAAWKNSGSVPTMPPPGACRA